MRRARLLVVATIAATLLALAGPGAPPAHAATTTIDLPTPAGSVNFGEGVLVLANGNFVIVDSDWGPGRGAVYLYNGATNQLISTLTGSTPGDNVGSGSLVEVGDSNFVVTSPTWKNGPVVPVAGAATWISGTTGLSGTVSAANSLVGTSSGDSIGSGGVSVTKRSNYLVRSPMWGLPLSVGALTFGSGNAGVKGAVSVSNSIIGTHDNDLQSPDVAILEHGNLAVGITSWDNGLEVNAGAVTFIDEAIGTSGVVSAANSLIGSKASDFIGLGVASLTNGNYVTFSSTWDNGLMADVGIATWGSGATGVVGVASVANSLIGQVADDKIGINLRALTNGNYVVISPSWHGPAVGAGAATWGNGTTGTTGVVTAANSIHGTAANDHVSSAMQLTNGNYVVYAEFLDVGGLIDAGGAMWASGTGPTSAAMSAANSIVGSKTNDRVGVPTPLSNGNYVLTSAGWQAVITVPVGAWTFALGTGPTALAVNATNSLVGSSLGDPTNSGVVTLANGNYFVRTPMWSEVGAAQSGAVTWASGTTGVVGAISESISLTGATLDDHVGYAVRELSNASVIVQAPDWNRGSIVDAGFVRVVSSTGPTVTASDAVNSLVGSKMGDRVGSESNDIAEGVLVRSVDWDNGVIVDAGAATLFAAGGGPTGVVTATNSVVGVKTGDRIGSGSITSFPTGGGMVLRSPGLDNGAIMDAGAMTYIDAANTTGSPSSTNSVFGTILSGGPQMRVDNAYTSADAVVVGRQAENIVTLLVTPDKTPPKFTQPPNLMVAAPHGSLSAVVDYALPSAADVRSIPAVACVPPPGSVFPIGVTTVTCTATDGVGLTATVSFTLTVTGDDYIPLSPARIADTRPGFMTIDGEDAGGGLREVGSTLALRVAGRGGVDAHASAVALNVTAVDALAPGFATVWPCGEPRPTASNLNFATGGTVPNAVLAKVGSDGTVCLFTSQPIHFVVDVNGYFPATTSYKPLNPARLLDTRADGTTVDGAQQAAGAVGADSTTTLQVTGRGGVPADATSVVLNVTTTESALDGYITAYPCDSERPNASSVNGVAGSTVANLVISKLGTGGTVCLYSQSATHLIADVNGYFAPGGSYVPLVPARLMDTRPGGQTVDGKSAAAGLVPLGSVTPLQVVGRGGVPAATTVVLNITVTEPGAPGYLTVYPCGIDPPNASNLNYTTGQTVANGALVKVGTGGNVCLYNSQPTHLIVDVTGYFPS
jgi:trimeric autotransporter adhesin